MPNVQLTDDQLNSLRIVVDDKIAAMEKRKKDIMQRPETETDAEDTYIGYAALALYALLYWRAVRNALGNDETY